MVNRNTIDIYTDDCATSFGKQVKARRDELNMSGNELAKQCLISRRWLQKIEKGKKVPSHYIISSISKALDHFEWEFFTLKRF